MKNLFYFVLILGIICLAGCDAEGPAKYKVGDTVYIESIGKTGDVVSVLTQAGRYSKYEIKILDPTGQGFFHKEYSEYELTKWTSNK